MLKPDGIGPKTIRLLDGTTLKGYLPEEFSDARARYLPAAATNDEPELIGVAALRLCRINQGMPMGDLAVLQQAHEAGLTVWAEGGRLQVGGALLR